MGKLQNIFKTIPQSFTVEAAAANETNKVAILIKTSIPSLVFKY